MTNIISVSIDKKILEKADAILKREGVTRSWYIRKCLKDLVKKEGYKDAAF